MHRAATPPAAASSGARRVARLLVLFARSERGFGLVETVMAMMLFLVVGSSLASVLTSSVVAHKVSGEVTLAQEAAQAQIEKVRALNYDDVGTVGGNPPGVLNASDPISVRGLHGTLRTKISFVADPVSASAYNQLANYKQVTVTVERASDAKVLAKEVTYVAPTTKAPYGGIDLAAIKATILDLGNNTPIPNATVALGTGPSAPRSDTTDSSGNVVFAALTANPTSGAQAYYDLTVTPPSGYTILSDDVSPSTASHVQLGPGQTWTTTIRAYQPATMTINVRQSGSPYAGSATVTVTSSRGTNTYTVTGGSTTITGVVPGIQYTVSAQTSDGLVADAVTRTVPDSYPTVLTSTFNLDLYRPTGTLRVTATKVGAPAAGAAVTVSGGPNSISLSGTADSSGVVSFTGVPAGNGYTVTATSGGNSGTQTTTVVGNTTTDVTVAIQVPTGTIKVTATQGGVTLKGGTVTITGGPIAGFSLTGTTDASGVYSASVPSGSGYTVTLSASGPSVSTTATVATGLTTPVALDLPLPAGTIEVTAVSGNRRNGCSPVAYATVWLSGGPTSGSWGPYTTNGGGVYTFSSVPVGSGYTVTARDPSNGRQSTSGAVVSQGSTTYVTVNVRGSSC